MIFNAARHLIRCVVAIVVAIRVAIIVAVRVAIRISVPLTGTVYVSVIPSTGWLLKTVCQQRVTLIAV